MTYRQAGITNRPPQHVLLASYDFADRSATGAAAALAGLANVVERELRSDLDPPTAPAEKSKPSAETGELGFDGGYDRGHLTITMGLAASAFDALAVPADERPSDLRLIPWDKLGDTPKIAASGDLILQICSDDPYVCEHVVRRSEEELGTALSVVWTQAGTQRYSARPGRTSRHEGRALIGFLDGTSNLNPRRSDDDAALVFVNPDPAAIQTYPANPPTQPGPSDPYGNLPSGGPVFPDLQEVPSREPEWTRNGTYMTVRASTFETTPWDDQSEDAQEHAVGRFKWSGASLDLEDDRNQTDADPAFVANQADERVPLNSHIRKANPRLLPEDARRRLFRRGYPIIGPAEHGLTRGLAFIAFARTTSTQFEFILRAWLRNKDFPHPDAGVDQLLFGLLPETVLCGGYYFVPPVRRAREPWTWAIPGVDL